MCRRGVRTHLSPVSLASGRWDSNETMPKMSIPVDSLSAAHDGCTKGVEGGAEVAEPGEA